MNTNNRDALLRAIDANEAFNMRLWTTDECAVGIAGADQLDVCSTPACIGGTCTFLVDGVVYTAGHYGGAHLAYEYHVNNTARFLGITYAEAEALCDPESECRDEDEEWTGIWAHLPEEVECNREITARQACQAIRNLTEVPA